MRNAWTIGASVALLSQTLFPLAASAASFPDVSVSNPYAVAISALADKKVINGNPDGTFAPDRTVNRAEFLTMLYRAKALTTSMPTAPCFKDVPANTWFAPVVCDAAGKGTVSGYKDGTFKPEQAVNRVEALKMLFTVHGLNQQGSPEATAAALAYPDISASAWYMQYVSAAFRLHILPVPGVSTSTFGPDQPLSRAEAAAYIYNAISTSPLPLSSSSSMTQSSAMTQQTSSATTTRSSKSASSVAAPTIMNVDFPFNKEGRFTNKLSNSFVFTLKQKTTVMTQVTIPGSVTEDSVSCRLYKLGTAADSFSLEYYLGYQSKESCIIRATLSAGSYQLDIAPLMPNLGYSLTTKTVTGDGNDGFTEAKLLKMNAPVSALLESTDFGDFYTFSLKEQTNMKIELTNAESMRCVIYPMEDVDIFGFSEPDCNVQYDFPAGTYYVGVMQRDGRASKQTYSIRTAK